MVIIGGLCHLYVIIIGAQAYPLRLVSGYRVNSGFYDGEITPYLPTLPEFALGIGGVSLALLMTMVAVRVLPFLPTEPGHCPDRTRTSHTLPDSLPRRTPVERLHQ
ncbi:MAG: hypothetical protein Ct9H300mP13_0760 [Gammaproteobacteria bacterium]|nr:MAG: hypothetical protein Ct9H300mP13_0760 [Gammaproteobacteria bacterium]